jgi:adenine-specific DNA methylase
MNFKQNESAQKLRGGYYTPIALASYLSDWVAEINPQTILEPSCGDGIFLQALSNCVLHQAHITAIEIENSEVKKAYERIENLSKPQVNIQCADFLEWYLKFENQQFDAVIGNPPFIRYQYLSERDQHFAARIFKKHNLPFTKHTNAWVPFVIASLALLKPNGRIAMVLPAEILHVLHAQSLRYFLGQQCKKILIIDPEEIWFDGTLQGVVLFMAEKKQSTKQHTDGLSIVQTTGNTFLHIHPTEYFNKNHFINGKTLESKWMRALLTQSELNLFNQLLEHDKVHQFETIAKVDVGIVTGANKFFLVNDEVVKQYQLEQWSYPMFGKSQHCKGIVYDRNQHQENIEKALPSNFLWFDVADETELSTSAIKYIRQGEKECLHTRYKCRMRNPWFKVPSVYATSIGMLKRAHDIPRLIYNDIEAYTTDTAYRITTDYDAKKLVYCFVNSFTALSSELEGRHYGGGVLELVPSEIEKVLIPLPEIVQFDINRLNNLIKQTKSEEVLAYQDNRILKILGLSNNDIITLNAAWNKLRKRRQRSTSKG